ncbi:MAG: Adaptive-response sensory-kinase SasA [Phycisphaerae bacterium]|nr:Adaptive-response sensory-kinase SasA [Phycisphaerae bacterium]
MLRGFRHTLFLFLQAGIAVSCLLALWLDPAAWKATLLCAAGAVLTSVACERIAGRYLTLTLGRLRRLADAIGRGDDVPPMEAHPGEDFYKLVSAINLVATRLAEATAAEKSLQEKLRRSERLAFLGELAANVAHEVNNPLDGVQNCARILRRSLREPERAEQMLTLIDSGLERIAVIVRRLLTLARQNTIRPAREDVVPVVERAAAAIAEWIGPRGVRVWVDSPRETFFAHVDAPLLEQVFVNLLLNGADSMPEGGDIHVRVARVGEGRNASVQVDVSDRGTGIAAEVLPHIFEPFFSTKIGERGTGLGLPIAARIVDAHGGEIRPVARSDGGTTFTVLLPESPVGARAAG